MVAAAVRSRSVEAAIAVGQAGTVHKAVVVQIVAAELFAGSDHLDSILEAQLMAGIGSVVVGSRSVVVVMEVVQKYCCSVSVGLTKA